MTYGSAKKLPIWKQSFWVGKGPLLVPGRAFNGSAACSLFGSKLFGWARASMGLLGPQEDLDGKGLWLGPHLWKQDFWCGKGLPWGFLVPGQALM